MTLLKPYEFIALWEQAGEEPSLSCCDLSNSNLNHQQALVTYAKTVLVEAVMDHPNMVELFSHPT